MLAHPTNSVIINLTKCTNNQYLHLKSRSIKLEMEIIHCRPSTCERHRHLHNTFPDLSFSTTAFNNTKEFQIFFVHQKEVLPVNLNPASLSTYVLNDSKGIKFQGHIHPARFWISVPTQSTEEAAVMDQQQELRSSFVQQSSSVYSTSSLAQSCIFNLD